MNVHASLLPKYRGAAPIQWVVIDGEKESGVTTMMMDVGLDTGDMLEQKVIPLDEKETGGSLYPVLEETGKSLVVKRVAQEKKKELTILGSTLKRTGAVSQMKSLISELKQYQIAGEPKVQTDTAGQPLLSGPPHKEASWKNRVLTRF